MGSDRARRTYDEKRNYRRVIAQQGRAIIEADINEAQEIATEELRREALDVVGPKGTPDDGYKVSKKTGSPPGHDLVVGKGTMYVGGMRVSLESDITSLLNQTDWRDGPVTSPTSTHELVYLHLTEQEVSAEEDRTLREVALGGPDTAQRSRLVQRIDRFALTGKRNCPDAIAEFKTAQSASGIIYDDPATPQQLTPVCTLKAEFDTLTSPDACSPASSFSGYLGAENQLVRVQISRTGKFVWAFDNASAIHRVSTASGSTITLDSRPVDEQHEPAAGQIVEILHTRVDLGSGEYVAAPWGAILTVTSYDRDQAIITLDGAVPSEYLADVTASKQLFVRIWQEEVTFTAGSAAPIGDTGLKVTLAGSAFPVGSYWSMALRPAAPQQILPKRYADAPQPPEGPRQWVCPLAVVDWDATTSPPAISSCRSHFDNLVELTAKSCGRTRVIVTPETVSGGSRLQDLIDAQVAGRVAIDEKIIFIFDPGIYELTAPVRLGAEHSNLVFEGNGKAVFTKAVDATASFVDGLVSSSGATEVALEGLTFAMASADFESAGGTLAGFSPTGLYDASSHAIDFRSLKTAVGLRVFGGSISVRDCVFDYSNVAMPSGSSISFAVGILLGGDVQTLSLERNRFSFDRALTSARTQVFGVIHSPSSRVMDIPGCRTVGGFAATLADGLIRDNHFVGLRAAVLIHAAPERLQVQSNIAEACYAGFWVLPRRAMASTESSLATRLSGLDSRVDGSAGGSVESDMATGVVNLLKDSLLAYGGVIARAYPTPPTTLTVPTTTMTDPAPLTSLNDTLVTIETAAMAAPPTGAADAVPNIIGITSNRIVCTGHTDDSFTGGRGTALVVWDAAWDVEGGLGTSVVVGANWMGGVAAFAPATLVGVERCAASGNTVQSLTDTPSDAYSMVVIPSTTATSFEVAVMGNTFSANTVLPKRSISSTEPSVPWSFFNQRLDTTAPGGTDSRGIEALYFDAEQTSPIISQRQRAGSGLNAGATLQIKGQQGQLISGIIDAYNNNGGDVHIDGGAPGTGGSFGRQGAVQLASSGYTVGVSYQGADIDLGAPTRSITDGDGHLIPMTGPARWLTSGTEFLSLQAIVGTDESGAEITYGAMFVPTGLIITRSDQAFSVMLDPNEGMKVENLPFVLRSAPLIQKQHDVATVSGTATIDLTKGCVHDVPITGTTNITFTGAQGNMRVEVRVRQISPGGYTITWDSNFVFAGSGADAPSSTGMTIYDFSCDGVHLYCMNVRRY